MHDYISNIIFKDKIKTETKQKLQDVQEMADADTRFTIIFTL